LGKKKLKTIFRTIFGSRLYGTNTPASDVDYKSVYIPSAEDILLQKIKSSVTNKRSKGEGEKNYAGEEEEECYSLDKFLKLVSEGQTVSLDILFSNPAQWLYADNTWKRLTDNIDKLLTKNSKAFIGYCRQQSAKYGIKGSRVAAARDTLNFLKMLNNDTRFAVSMKNEKLGNCAPIVELFAKNKEFVGIVDVPQVDGSLVRFLEVCGRKLSYKASIPNALSIVQKLVDEYGSRALLAEKNEGIDWKALSHAVRIGEEAIELFETHNIVFPRWNAEYLKDIKAGRLPYQEVAERIEELFEQVEIASEKSTLPESVDKQWIDNFVLDTYGEEVYTRFNEKDSH
jgi:predicted nucleotidyltransferase